LNRRNLCVAKDDVRQQRRFEIRVNQEQVIQFAFEKEPIAIASAFELVTDNKVKGLANQSAVDVSFGKPADPEVNIID